MVEVREMPLEAAKLEIYLPCFKIYMVLVAVRLVDMRTFSRLEVSSSTFVSFSRSLWKLLTSPVGNVALVRCPSGSYLWNVTNPTLKSLGSDNGPLQNKTHLAANTVKL